MKVTIKSNINLPKLDKKYKLVVGIINDSFLASMAKELDQGTDKIIKIPARVLKVVPEAIEMGFLEWDGIPSRPFIERTIALYKHTWGKVLLTTLKSNGFNMFDALNVLGGVVLEQLKMVVCDESWQHPNSDIWKLFKERTGTDMNPLMHTHKFLNALKYEVIEI